MSIATFAETKLDDYDRVFCVFDRDGHANFNAALQRIATSQAGKSGKLKAVVSWPCFEVWVLLHFVYTTQAFTSSGGRSACENVIRALQQHYGAYAKASDRVFDDTAPHLDNAVARAVQLEAHTCGYRGGEARKMTEWEQFEMALVTLEATADQAHDKFQNLSMTDIDRLLSLVPRCTNKLVAMRAALTKAKSARQNSN